MFPLFLALPACFLLTSPEPAATPDEVPEESGAVAEIEPAPACADYLACIGEVDPSSLAVLVDTYGGDGSCWSDAATASTCEAACESELARLLEQYPEVPECGGTAPAAVEWPFQAGHWDAHALDVGGTCPGLDESVLDAVNAMLDQYGVAFEAEDEAFPDFQLDAFFGDQDCTLDGDRYTCTGDSSVLADSDTSVTTGLTGRFDDPTHTTATWIAREADCTATLTLDLTANPEG